MGPHRILFIRHAEKPGAAFGGGVNADGRPDEESLAVRGWQRAGALTQRFGAHDGPLRLAAGLATVYAAGLGKGSQSKRSMQTVAPLVALLQASEPLRYETGYAKDDGAALMADVLMQTGVILIAWEHKVLPSLVARLPDAPVVPSAWPDDRFDMIWILDRASHGWSFTQQPQLLLAGDSASPIA
ncbi:phosphoglycerate mutase family protein [Paraburkholderia sp. J76]|uniref:phosphoglycerate mutase family protein n=1 Tax=Paraburkholderia sp. J76 TaxID=2805439 RepID=UPI002ABDABE6|nr:phosphoglycerate mutase family protein [Paraburkholderia sp. J76]